jgi:hypothetical protein
MFKSTAAIILAAAASSASAVYLGNPLDPRNGPDSAATVLVSVMFAPTPTAGTIDDYRFFTSLASGTVDLVLLTPVSGTTYNISHRQTVTWSNGSGTKVFATGWAAPAGSIVSCWGRGPNYDDGGGSGTVSYVNYDGSDFLPPQGSNFDTATHFYNASRYYSFGANFTPVPEPMSLATLSLGAMLLVRSRRKRRL